jgi:hypothetical protein
MLQCHGHARTHPSRTRQHHRSETSAVHFVDALFVLSRSGGLESVVALGRFQGGIALCTRVINSELKKSILLIPPKTSDSHIGARTIHPFGSFGLKFHSQDGKQKRFQFNVLQSRPLTFEGKQLLSLVVPLMNKSTIETLLRVIYRVSLPADAF